MLEFIIFITISITILCLSFYTPLSHSSKSSSRSLTYSGRLDMLESNIKKNVNPSKVIDRIKTLPEKINPILAGIEFQDVIVQQDTYFSEWHYTLYFSSSIEVHLGISEDLMVEYSIYNSVGYLIESDEVCLDNIPKVLNNLSK